LALLAAIMASGCATHDPVGQTSSPARPFPAEGLITQRAVLTAQGRQYALNGYTSLSAAGGKRLIITEMFGQTMADVLVKPDGEIYVMHSSRAFRPAWIRHYVAADLQCIFGGEKAPNCPVRILDPNHFVIERRWYKLDLRLVETREGPQRSEMFDETRAEQP
jgi:hypothetical protein